MKVLLSIKPKYAELILEGEKKYEFRRSIFKNPSVKKVVIYASSPISKVVGEFEIEDILSLNLAELWKHTMEHSGIDKEFYDSYFLGKDIGHAIKVKSVKRYSKHKELKDFDINYAPQSFARYSAY
jgi:predicted transcriptional regulator